MEDKYNLDPRLKNTGALKEERKVKDWVFGGISGGGRTVCAPNGQYADFLPPFESQFRYGLETMSCVSQSLCNCLEIYFRAMSIDPSIDFSDRFLAKMSDTSKRGNSFSNVANTASKKGLAEESTWKWTEDINTWDKYYSSPPSAALQSAMRFLEKYKIHYEWVDAKIDDMKESLKYGPLQACSHGHAYVISGYEDGKEWKIFDTYGDGMRVLPWGHKYDGIMLFTVSANEGPPEEKPLVELSNDCLVFEGTGPGRLGLHLSGKMFVDESQKIIGSWITRNSDGGMFVGAPVRTIPTQEFSRFPHYDLKGNKLN